MPKVGANGQVSCYTDNARLIATRPIILLLAKIQGSDLLAAEREAKAKELKEAASKLEEMVRLEDLSVREVDYWKGKKNYPRWIASWRDGDKIRTGYLGSCKKIGREEALRKARKLKADVLKN